MAVSVHDVTAFILKKCGKMTTMKLQKLIYYCQAWSLVWDEEPLFSENIEAWANGPVVKVLYVKHKGLFTVSKWPSGKPDHLKYNQMETICGVLDFYGDKTSQWLSDLTHNEDPWKNARQGLSPGERSDRIISHADMAEYYSSL